MRNQFPSVDTNTTTFSETKLKRFESRISKFENELRSKYTTLPKIPGVKSKSIIGGPYSLREKTKITDYFLAEKRKPNDLNYSDEWQYLMVYKYLSGGAHINANYLANNTIHKDKTGISIYKHGNKDRTSLCAWSAQAFLYDISTIFSKQFGYPSYKDLRPYQKKLNKLKDKLPD